MAKSYQQVLQQIESLKKMAESLRRKEVEGVISRIRDAIEAYGLTAQDLGLAGGRPPTKRRVASDKKPSKPKAARTAKKVQPKYKDDSGNTWSGRGLKPRWLTAAIAAGKKLEDFAI